jgi:transcriptional regulator with XRE-family HTH domain
MMMADKIIEQRKKNGWSQEELADRLHVRRQSVSKWEGAQSVPDLNKVIAMADLFGVSTDYLLKDDVEDLPMVVETSVSVDQEGEAVRKVSLEEAHSYLSAAERSAGQISVGVMLCILSPILLIIGASAGAAGLIPLTEDQASILGCIILMLIVAAAVFLFVKNGMQLSKYDYLENELIDTEYGVISLAKERKQEYEHSHLMGMTVGVILCVLSAVPILGAALAAEDNELLMSVGVGITLALIAVGVWQIVRVSIIWESYQKLLEEGDYTRKKKRSKDSVLSGIYWAIVTAVYLGWSFWTMEWHRTWIIWPVAGVLYAVVRSIEEAMQNRK